MNGLEFEGIIEDSLRHLEDIDEVDLEIIVKMFEDKAGLLENIPGQVERFFQAQIFQNELNKRKQEVKTERKRK